MRRLEPAHQARALASVVEAFAVDPALRWVWPEDTRYAGCATAFFGLLLDLRRQGGEVWAARGGAAVAMWDPPGGLYSAPAVDPWPALQDSFTRTERARWAMFDAALAVPPGVPAYWYLGVLATSPDQQGQGLGERVLEPVLDSADRTGTAAWLETMSERNVGFYARRGFEVAREVDLPDGGPRCWLMYREPRGEVVAGE